MFCPYSKVLSLLYEDNGFYYARSIRVGCGKCLVCRQKRQSEWMFRIKEEAKANRIGRNYFVTLTYDEDHLPANNNLYYRDVQRFFKRLRHKVGKFRYYAIGEYGFNGTERAHYHFILFGPNLTLKQMYLHIKQRWKFGIVDCKQLTDSRINYIASYSTFLVPNGNVVRPFSRMSNRPAIGYDWLASGECFNCVASNRKKVIRAVYNRKLNKYERKEITIPRYYQRKLFPRLRLCEFDDMRARQESDFARYKISVPLERISRNIYLPKDYVENSFSKYRKFLDSHNRRKDHHQHIDPTKLTFEKWLQFFTPARLSDRRNQLLSSVSQMFIQQIKDASNPT